MINVEIKHDFEVKKLAIGGIIIGATIGITTVVTKEVAEKVKTKIKELKENKK